MYVFFIMWFCVFHRRGEITFSILANATWNKFARTLSEGLQEELQIQYDGFGLVRSGVSAWSGPSIASRAVSSRHSASGH